MNLSPDEQFFYDNAGCSFQPATETREQGRERCARELAAAEQRLLAGPYFIDIVPDDEPYDGPVWCVALVSVADDDNPTTIGSLCGVACDDGDHYLRVIAAELADEYIPA